MTADVVKESVKSYDDGDDGGVWRRAGREEAEKEEEGGSPDDWGNGTDIIMRIWSRTRRNNSKQR